MLEAELEVIFHIPVQAGDDLNDGVLIIIGHSDSEADYREEVGPDIGSAIANYWPLDLQYYMGHLSRLEKMGTIMLGKKRARWKNRTWLLTLRAFTALD